MSSAPDDRDPYARALELADLRDAILKARSRRVTDAEIRGWVEVVLADAESDEQ